MLGSMLNPEAPIPLYRQLADELEDCIYSGKLATGERIPSEHELSSLHGIGRPTVRQATDYLVRLGLLERRRGSGTFVLPPRTQVDLFTLGGTIAAFEGAGLVLRTSIIESVKHHVQLDAEAGPLADRVGFTFARLGSVDGHPVLLERMYLDATVFPGFDAQPVEHEALSRLVQRHYHRRPVGGKQTIRVWALTAREASALKVEPKHGALLIERTLNFVSAKAALFARIFVLTDRVALAQSLTDSLALAAVSATEEEEA
jgi:GntR family transcriptional regulator